MEALANALDGNTAVVVIEIVPATLGMNIAPRRYYSRCTCISSCFPSYLLRTLVSVFLVSSIQRHAQERERERERERGERREIMRL